LRDRRLGQAAARRGPHRDGQAVQGDRCREPVAAAIAGLRAAFEMTAMLQATSLSKLAGISHGFFTRAGGVSAGLYESLNGGIGSNDPPQNVAENRARMAKTLGVAPDRLLSCYQIHSPEVVVAETPWPQDARPRADAIVTKIPKLAIG